MSSSRNFIFKSGHHAHFTRFRFERKWALFSNNTNAVIRMSWSRNFTREGGRPHFTIFRHGKKWTLFSNSESYVRMYSSWRTFVLSGSHLQAPSVIQDLEILWQWKVLRRSTPKYVKWIIWDAKFVQDQRWKRNSAVLTSHHIMKISHNTVVKCTLFLDQVNTLPSLSSWWRASPLRWCPSDLVWWPLQASCTE